MDTEDCEKKEADAKLEENGNSKFERSNRKVEVLTVKQSKRTITVGKQLQTLTKSALDKNLFPLYH